MKSILAIGCLFLLTTFSACKNSHEPDNRKTYLVKLTNYLGSTTYSYDDQDRLVSENFKTADASVVPDNTTTYSDFNAAGNPAKVTYHVPATSTTTTSGVEYDAHNRLIKLSNYNASNALTGYYAYTYLSNTISETSYYPTGAFSQRFVYTYDAKNNISSMDIYNYTNTLVQRVTYGTYDDRKSPRDCVNALRRHTYPLNNATAYEIALSSQTYPFTSVHEYNADGYVTKSTTTNKTSGLVRVVTYEYTKK